MNANITGFSSEELRQVDLTFACAKSEAPAKIQDLMIPAMKTQPQALTNPEPFDRVSGGGSDAMEFTVRAQCQRARTTGMRILTSHRKLPKLSRKTMSGPPRLVLPKRPKSHILYFTQEGIILWENLLLRPPPPVSPSV